VEVSKVMACGKKGVEQCPSEVRFYRGLIVSEFDA
jgi:hypothetical protein